jgi:hypothetical protein
VREKIANRCKMLLQKVEKIVRITCGKNSNAINAEIGKKQRPVARPGDRQRAP